MAFYQTLLEGFALFQVLESHLYVHSSALNWQNTLQLVQNGQSLLLGRLRVDHLAVDLLHGAKNDRARELVAILRIYRLLADPVRDIQLDFLYLVISLHLRHLKLALVQNLNDDLITAHLAKLFHVCLAGDRATFHVCKDLFNL